MALQQTPYELYSNKLDAELSQPKTSRQRVSVACVNCNKSHASCETGF